MSAIRRHAALTLALMGVGMALPATAAADGEAALEGRVEALEERVQRLEQQLEQRLGQAPESDEGQETEADRRSGEGRAGEGRLQARYWLGKEDPFQEGEAEPRARGAMGLPERLTLDPEEFDLPDTGTFSQWRNPARYPVVAVELTGRLITEAGTHELVIRPQPVAEGGAGRRTRMRVRVALAGETVLDTGLTDRRAEHRADLPEFEGERALTIEVLAQGEGVGPSPTGSAVLLRMKPPGAARLRPLADFVALP
ncbi:MAG: hypothetical protein ACQERG_07590 [Pseudomonadota bacterium]